MGMTPQERIREQLAFLYRDETDAVWAALAPLLDQFARDHPELGEAPPPSERLSERDAVLITYGDQVRAPGVSPLQTLADFGQTYLDGLVTALHILPFYPYSSDDGFSVIDYWSVNPDLGTWSDVRRCGDRFRLMFDAVINHISRKSAWFERYLDGEAPYTGFFITVPEGTDLSQVVRPRALPLLTPVDTVDGRKLVWTTFSDDQIDLNYASPELLLRILELLLFYVSQGAEIIRLDAIAYLWKEVGSSCIHVPQTYAVVRLFRAVLDAVAPGVLLITETNVPHEENISYFGEPLASGGTDSAQLVYQFSLAPLTMHSVLAGDATALTQWASDLAPPAQATFFNFTASHDGIGVRPAEGLLSPQQVQDLVDATIRHGGRVSYKSNADGSQSAYELNISYFDALSDPAADEPLDLQVARFITSQAIMLSLAGVPGIYVHSLLGSRSWHAGVAQTGRNRTINREKLAHVDLERALADPRSVRSKVYRAYAALLRARASSPAFHPYGEQEVLSLDPRVFAVLRRDPRAESRVLCLHNVSDRALSVDVAVAALGGRADRWQDVLAGEQGAFDGAHVRLALAPYAVRWLQL